MTARCIQSAAPAFARLGAAYANANTSAAAEDLNLRVIGWSEVWIPGAIVPKARPRLGKGRTRTPKRTRDFEATVRDTWRVHGLQSPTGTDLVALVSVDIYAPRVGDDVRKRRAGRLVKARARGDVDNQAKAILDGLQKAGAVANDSHVVELRIRRMLVPEVGQEPGAVVVVLWAQPRDVVEVAA